jgi:hypothetical protein
MTFQINTLHWDNVDPHVLQSHRRVLEHFGFPVKYTSANIGHGQWMDRVLRESTTDVVGFLDCDCVPLSRAAITTSVEYAYANDTFVGVAQVSNYIEPRSHIYAAPSFLFVARSCYERLGTSMAGTSRSDVGEEFCYAAEAAQVSYRALYPTHFSREPRNGAWRLGNYGIYGIGTVFGSTAFHLFKCRSRRNTDLFVEQCDRIIHGAFTTVGMSNATDLSYPGRIARSSANRAPPRTDHAQFDERAVSST